MGKAPRKKSTVSNAISLAKSRRSGLLTSIKRGILYNPIFHILLIAIIGLISYSNTFNVPFHFDDTATIVANYKLKDLTNFWPPSGSRWFGFLTFALNYYFGGLNVTGYHIVNLAIHVFNAIFIYWLVVLTFRTPFFMVRQAHHDTTVTLSHEPVEWSKGHHSPIHPFTYLPLFIALIFVSHPVQTQAVTYIVQRFASLATFFYLLSLIMYIKFRNQQLAISGQQKLYATPYTLYAVSLISAVLAMKTKEISFTLPVIMVFYEFMFFEGKFKKRILYLLPLLLTMLIIPLSMIGIDNPIGDAIGELREAAQETEEIPRWSYLFTQFKVIVTYIRLLVLPINQNLDYDYPLYHSFFEPNVFLSFLFLLSLIGLGIYLLYRSRFTSHASRFLAFGILWFFITLSVESSIIPIRDIINEHRLYLPSVGIIIAFTSSAFYVLQFTIHRSRFIAYASRFSLPAACSLLTAIIIALSIATYKRNTVWQDEVSFWEDGVRKSPKKARSYNLLGTSYAKQKQFEKAIQQFQTALKLKPAYPLAYYNMGLTYVEQEQIDNAIQAFQAALNLQPKYAEAYNDIGIAYDKKGMIDNAIQAFQAALTLQLDFPNAHNNIGIAYVEKGLIYNAIEHYKIALKLDPNNATIHLNLGIAYQRIGDTDNARKEVERALQIDPSHYQALQFLDYIYEISH
ncbi:MAG: hypothetical protein FD156_1664 [Nitrospirae bacterium]|nr:MAG: hypothetical protein FD156_1664 [Nitrospirota bacterium]